MMLLPPYGFAQRTVLTSTGSMVYYTNESEAWPQEGSAIADRPTLAFIHGFGGGSSSYEWSKVYPAFASQYRVIAPDLIGWGQSEHLARSYQIDDYLDSIAEFLEKTCSTPTTVVASSLTAAFMVRMAIAHPHLIKSLILVAPAGLKDFGKEIPSFVTQLLSVPVLDWLLYRGAIATEASIRGFLEQRTFARPERVYPEIVEAYLKSAEEPNAEYSALSFVRGDLSFDLAEYITQLQIPTAIIWGREAKFTEYQIGDRLANLNPGAIKAFQVLDNVGLTPQLELPAVTIGLIHHYLDVLATTAMG